MLGRTSEAHGRGSRANSDFTAASQLDPTRDAEPTEDALVAGPTLAGLDSLALAVLEVVPDALFLCSDTGRVLGLSRAAIALCRGFPPVGRRVDELLGLAGTQTDVVGSHPASALLIARALGGERMAGVDIELPGDHGPRRLRLHASPVMAARARYCWILLTEPARRGEARPPEGQRSDAAGRLISGIAHEFNNILTTIVGFSELTLDELGPDHAAHDAVVAIRDGGERLTQLTRKLLAHSRVPAAAPRVVSLEEVVRNVEPLIRRVLREEVQLATDLDPLVGHVRIDITQIEQVLLHLVVHARGQVPLGGKILLETRAVEIPAGEGPVPPGRYARIVVRESPGPRAGGRTTREGIASVSLGLASVRGLLQHNGGHVVVETDGGGVRFLVLLPIAGRIVTVAAPSTPLNHEDWRGEATVLLVEDEVPVRRFVADILQLKGYTVLEAENGEDALRVHASFEGDIDIVLTDIAMPVMGGRELVQHLRSMRPSLRVVYMSGYADESGDEPGRPDSGYQFLAKPFTMRTLLETLRRA